MFAGAASAALAAPSAPSASPAADFAPCRVIKHAEAVYPARALAAGVTRGEASIVLEIDPAGQVLDRLVTAYTHPEFAREAERTVAQWTYVPGNYQGQPVVCVLTVTFEFSVNGVLAIQKWCDPAQPSDAYIGGTFAYFAHGAGTLDRVPVPVRAPAPPYLPEWASEGRRGKVTVRFFIDETGRARFPTIAAEPDSLLARAAVTAVKQWQFEPPRAKGQPVLAYAEQTFDFRPAPPANGS